jgi:hypothetical protein
LYNNKLAPERRPPGHFAPKSRPDHVAWLRDDAKIVQSEDDMAQGPNFEIPPHVRELAEKNVEQASAAYGQFMDAMNQAMGMWWQAMPPSEMTSGLKAVQERAVRFAKQNADAGFALASSLANAKDFQDVLALQGHYAQTQMHTYALQAQELGRLMAESLQNPMTSAETWSAPRRR